MSETTDRRTLFVVGCPRSGTTWVQLLLAQHPLVATAPETQIFAYYLESFKRQWNWEREGVGGTEHGGAGLNRLLSDEEFDAMCRGVAWFVLERIAARNPGGHLIVEKSPRHALEAVWIARLLPDARFLHVIRDPRDTAASLFAAGADWAPWAPRNPTGAAELWRDCVGGARELASQPDRYLELRYEHLRRDPEAGLRDVLHWVGLPADPEFCRDAVEQCRLDRLQKGVSGDTAPIPNRKSPAGFFRRGTVGGWRDELAGWKVRIIEDICGPLMDELGYERVSTAGSVPVARLRRGLHDGLSRLNRGVHWRMRHFLKRF